VIVMSARIQAQAASGGGPRGWRRGATWGLPGRAPVQSPSGSSAVRSPPWAAWSCRKPVAWSSGALVRGRRRRWSVRHRTLATRTSRPERG